MMSGFLGIGGSSAKTDRSNELAGFADLKNLFNWALPTAQAGVSTGKATTAGGVAGLDTASRYWQSLLSSRPAAEQAVAPEANAARAQADAQKRKLASLGTARGGGIAATNRQADTDVMAKIDNLLFGIRPVAAGEVGKLEAEKARIGLAETSTGLSAGGLASGTASNLSSIASGSRATSFDINRATQQAVVDAALAVMGAF